MFISLLGVTSLAETLPVLTKVIRIFVLNTVVVLEDEMFCICI